MSGSEQLEHQLVPLPMDALSNRDLGNFRSGSGQIFVMFCEPSLSRLNTWSCWRVTALVECCDHEGTYWVGDLCQLDPEIPNSTLNCHTVISVIHFTSPLNVVTVSHLRTPQDPPGGAGGRFCRERDVWTTLFRLLPSRVDSG